ncbi:MULTISPECIES: SufE family protein [Gordonibacter]|uniref:SufE family protein n=1 Tax=Gordonibacter faecis TaxID=3047475 RepID=A0ABT7DNY9_9ACTN|nr:MULTISPECIES: SufE family protein [unclassified Gordonibacter]MDJ1651263.1 SufE family protein [Gordonibacter sp. KGMB12511]HIW76196.1 SufE family protein [Candidatus Gordonibacter avicola]
MNPACEAQNELVGDFNELDDPFFRYEYLLGLAAELPVMSDADKERSAKVEGCQSQVWMRADSNADGTLLFAFESDTLIVRGILRVMQLIYSGRTPADIVDCEFDLPVRAGLDDLFEAQRRSGMRSIASAVRAAAEVSS